MTLPIDDIFPDLIEAQSSHNRVILQAPPGAGKSTRLPQLLLDTGRYSAEQQIIILEPRRVAARQIARYLAASINEKVGQTIGLRMRGENLASANTRLLVVTDGVLVRMLQDDPELNKVALIIFDEFHERALQTDLALALTLDAQELNESLSILIMSATLDADKLATELNAPVVTAEGRQYPIELIYRPSGVIPSTDDMVKTIQIALAEQDSSILVFVSGVAEIKRITERLSEQLDDNVLLCQLYGGLSIEEQTLAIKPAEQGKRKVVLATNIAQTSLTIEGIDVVIDSGIEKVVNYDAKSMDEVLSSQLISKASATQRAGRAGRLRAGVCYRFGDESQFSRRRAFDIPDIERVDIAQLLLEVSLWGAKFDDLYWLSKPSDVMLNRAQQKLTALGYWTKIGDNWQTTAMANAQANIGTDLHLARAIVQAQQSDNELKQLASIFVALLEQPSNKISGEFSQAVLSLSGRDWSLVTSRLRQLANSLSVSTAKATELNLDRFTELAIAAFPNRIAKKQGGQWKLSNGVGANFHHSQIEPNSELIVVLSTNTSDRGCFINSYLAVTLGMVKQQNSELITTEVAVRWSDKRQAPYCSEQVLINDLVVEETPTSINLDAEQWTKLWLDYVIAQGWQALSKDSSVLTLSKKMLLANLHLSGVDWPDWQPDALMQQLHLDDNWLSPYLAGVRSVKQLKALKLDEVLLNSLDWSTQQMLMQNFPDSYQTPAGNKRKIDYLGEEPKLSVKLQEMFGEPQTPSICIGKVKLVIELLSPAQRPLQLTKDLATFWQNAYQEVKKEMKGRYPKHPWPDDPVNFIATSKTKRHL